MREAMLTDFGTLFLPREAMEPILAAPVRNALLEWLTEIFAEDELKELGIRPRRRGILDGPPGVGKTTLAHHLAARVGLPMVAIRPERLIDKWVGSTARNIGALFDAAERGVSLDGSGEEPVPAMLFFDEFDAIGHKRRSGTETGAEDERNAFVNTLLQRMEQYEGFVIAATNFGEHIDIALWRRFDMHITLQNPGPFERERILALYLKPFGLPKRSLKLLADGFETASPALMRQFCEHLKRQIVIGPKLDHDMRPAAVFERLVTSVQPHPDLPKPPMWASATADHARDLAVRAMPWPLPLASELPVDEPPPASRTTEDNVVVAIGGRTR